MIKIDDSLITLVPTLLDAKLCNYYYSGLNIVIETLSEYLTRIPKGYRAPGALINILIPKSGHSAGTFLADNFGTVVADFDFKIYSFIEGDEDENFIEIVIKDISNFVVKEDGKVLSDNNYTTLEKNKLASLNKNTYTLTFPQGDSTVLRCMNITAGVNYPLTWVVAPGSNPKDLSITHNLNREIVSAFVWTLDGNNKRILYGNSAFAGLIAPSKNQLIVENLSTYPLPIYLHLIFD